MGSQGSDDGGLEEEVVEVHAHNRLTTKSKRFFNVNQIKRAIADYFKSKTDFDQRMPRTHVYVTGVIEDVLFTIVDESIKDVAQDERGLRTLKRSHIVDAIKKNQELLNLFFTSMGRYDEKSNYTAYSPMKSKDVDSFVDFKFSSLVELSCDARNTICYLVTGVVFSLCYSFLHLLLYAKKKTITMGCVITAVKLGFSGSTELLGKCLATIKDIDNFVSDKGSGSEAGSEEEEEEDEEEKEEEEEKEKEKEKEKKRGKKEKKEKKETKDEDMGEPSEPKKRSSKEPKEKELKEKEAKEKESKEKEELGDVEDDSKGKRKAKKSSPKVSNAV